MGNRTNPGNWDARQRLEFIELAAYWRGWIRRADLQSSFGISLPQASADFQAYLRINPRGLEYDLSGKRYIASRPLKPRLTRPDLGSAIAVFLAEPRKAGFVRAERFANIDLPTRKILPEVARDVFMAVHEGFGVEVHYLSIHSGTARWRWILPHAFAHDGYRWHVRAFCPEDRCYKDFVLGRITATRAPVRCDDKVPADKDWTEFVVVSLRAHAALDKVQRAAVEHDFAMNRGELKLRVRKAMLEYTLAYLGIRSEGPTRLQLAKALSKKWE